MLDLTVLRDEVVSAAMSRHSAITGDRNTTWCSIAVAVAERRLDQATEALAQGVVREHALVNEALRKVREEARK